MTSRHRLTNLSLLTLAALLKASAADDWEDQ